MRGRRILIGSGVLVILLLATVAALRPRGNELDFLRPYAKGEQTLYVSYITMRRGTEFVRDHRIYMTGVPTQHIVDLLEQHFSAEKGWKETMRHAYSHYDVKTGLETGDFVQVDDDSTVYFEHDMTPLEVKLVRLWNFGRDPFVYPVVN